MVFSPAHSNSDHVTMHRHQTMDKYSQAAMRSIGIPVVDAAVVTQSRFEESYDGVHFLFSFSQGSSEAWFGSVSFMVGQVVLNTIFQTCAGAA